MDIIESTKNYYGKVLQKSSDLKTNACCTNIRPPKYILDAIKNIHDDINNSYYGCGLVIPDCLKDMKIIDLGCGTGRDVYILSQLVGQNGNVLGIDMTDEQLEIANKYLDYHKEKFNYSNVEFRKGYIEKLSELGLKENSYDIIVSNCVVNLCENKEKVFREVYNLLKTGGEFYFSDVYSDRRISEDLQKDEVLWGECLSGSLYWNDFINLVKKCGFTDPRLVSSNNITVKNKELENKLGNIKFYSATYRLFKLPNILEPDCEDYGQAVIYKGNIKNHPNYWNLDEHHRFEKGKCELVCGNTFNMLYQTRFRDYFNYINLSEGKHYGIFDGCGKSCPFSYTQNSKNSGCC